MLDRSWRWARLMAGLALILAGLAGSPGSAGAEEEKHDPKRAAEFEAILPTMPEFWAVERVLAGAAPSLSRLGAANYLRFSIDNFKSDVAEELASFEIKNKHYLDSEGVSTILRENTEALMPRVGCFIAFADHPSLSAQWDALKPLLAIDSPLTWAAVDKAVRERCTTAIDAAGTKPVGATASTLFGFGEQAGQKSLSDQPFALIATIAGTGFFDAKAVLSDLQRRLKEGLDSQDRIVTVSRPLIQGTKQKMRDARYEYARLMCRYDARYCDLKDVFKASDNASFCKSLTSFMANNRANTKPLMSGRRQGPDEITKSFEYTLVKYSNGCIDPRKDDNYKDFFLNRAKDLDYVKRAFDGKIELYSPTKLTQTFQEFSVLDELSSEFNLDVDVGWRLYRYSYLALQALPGAYRASLEASRPFLGDGFVNKALAEIPVDRSPATRESEEALALGKDDIRDIQSRLNATGAQIVVNGAMGKAARAALRQWQGALGYEPTGFLNQAQLNDLRERTKDRVALAPPSTEIKEDPSPKAKAAPQKPARRQAQKAPRRYVGDGPVRPGPYDDGSQAVGQILFPLLGVVGRRCAFWRCY